MAVLSNADRADITGLVQADLSRRFDSCSINRAALRAAIDALDSFLDANAANINAALPQPARSQLTTQQKALLLSFVIKRRYISGV